MYNKKAVYFSSISSIKQYSRSTLKLTDYAVKAKENGRQIGDMDGGFDYPAALPAKNRKNDASYLMIMQTND